MRVISLILTIVCAVAAASAQPREVTRTWLFSGASNALYDSYLSPLDYKGPSAGITMVNERTASWGCERVSSMAVIDLNGTYADNPNGNAHYYDGQLSVDMGWHYNWRLALSGRQHLRLRLGGLGELSGGGTYSTRNGNNPAQGRASLALMASFVADYSFGSPFRRQRAPWNLRLQADAPIVGTAFAMRYGQSYYELFGLGHYDRNVCLTTPLNAPSARMLVAIDIPIRRASLVVGYKGDVRQSTVNDLKRHSWNNGFIVGFRRNLSF